jgi:hypothetical protein
MLHQPHRYDDRRRQIVTCQSQLEFEIGNATPMIGRVNRHCGFSGGGTTNSYSLSMCSRQSDSIINWGCPPVLKKVVDSR